jgi:MoaA/NifB/PqqE/SkfB family radical SAM enzyme
VRVTYIDLRAKVLRHLDRLAGWQAGEKPAPVTVEWDLSNRCVLGCQDCHFAHTHTRGPWASKSRTLPMAYEGTGDLADVALVKRVLDEMKDCGVQGIVWSGGGEPTTHPHWEEIIDYAYGIQQGMYTCGTLLTRDNVALLADRTEWVVVSLDAVDAETYAAEKGVSPKQFDAACAGIRYLAEDAAPYGVPVVGVSFLLHAGNYTKAWDMLELARSLGATYTTFRPAIRTSPDAPSQCTDDRRWITAVPWMFDTLARESDVEISPERFRDYATWSGHGYTECHGPRLNTTITPDGRVWICPQRRGVTALGDLRVESFAELWARHPGQYTVDAGCRVMCRLHPVNEHLHSLAQPCAHEAFV